MIQFDEDKQEKRISDLYRREEEEVAQMLASRSGIKYVNFTYSPVNSDAIRLIEEKEAREARIVAFDRHDKRVDVAIISPQFEAALQSIERLKAKGHEVVIHIASMGSLEKAWAAYKDLSFAVETKAGSLEVSNEEIAAILKEVKTVTDVKNRITSVLSQNKSFRISKTFEIVLAGALATGASDVHIEPEEEYVRLRYRLDGVLNNIINFDRETYGLLLSRIKLLAGLKLNIKNDAQDGRLSVKMNDSDIEIRVSVLPGAYNESVVMRILNPKSISVPLEELGIDAKLLDAIIKELNKPDGMLLNTGPTGSGKTTTLYAFLKKVHTPDIKIITIEDPIEYHLPGIVQTQTDAEKGYTFLAGLRASLRQDPDVIMIGEIRDEETAQIAIQSALTGHLVFSTLHTNNAAGTFPRLIDLKINPKIIGTALSVAMAQRLIRKLCPHCKKEAVLEGDLKTQTEKIVASIVDKNYTKDLGPLTKHWIAGGCEKCNMTGYKGRIGVYEAIFKDPKVEDVIVKNLGEREVKIASIPQGFLDMRQDGVLKVIKGISSFEELSRVIDIEEEVQSA